MPELGPRAPSVSGSAALACPSAGRTVGGDRAALPTLLVAPDPTAKDPVVTSSQGATALNQHVQLMPAEPVEFAGRVVGGDYDAAAEQWHCSGGETGGSQKYLSGAAVDFAIAPPGRRSEPEVELSIGTAQAFKPVVVNKLGDIGVAVGAGFIDDADRAEIEDGVHVIVLCDSCCTDRSCGQLNHTDVIPQITDALNLANKTRAIRRFSGRCDARSSLQRLAIAQQLAG